MERGTAAIVSEVAAADGRYEGYTKPLLEDIDVFAWQKDRRKNFLHMAWKAIVGTISSVFKNQPNSRLATIIPISGNYAGTDTDVLIAVGGMLKNAFVRALLPTFEHRFGDTEEPEKVKDGTTSSAP